MLGRAPPPQALPLDAQRVPRLADLPFSQHQHCGRRRQKASLAPVFFFSPFFLTNIFFFRVPARTFSNDPLHRSYPPFTRFGHAQARSPSLALGDQLPKKKAANQTSCCKRGRSRTSHDDQLGLAWSGLSPVRVRGRDPKAKVQRQRFLFQG